MGTAALFRPTSLETSATTLDIMGGWVSKAACVNELFPSQAATSETCLTMMAWRQTVERDNLNPVDAFQKP